ncbi:MAG: asparagine synthase C-terminal domain-containing protein, partial [Myxococcales bacterium]|nr:asparagine synthase C-terminal domain-containing protein [Myxococcales bacterium]
SEAKALLALPGFERRIEPAFFLGPGMGLPDTARSPFAGIRSVRAGHLLTVDASGERERCWWTPRFPGGGPSTLDEAGEALRTALRRAVRRRVGGDVPIALALSSGLDSAIVAALATEVRSDLRAFTVAWPDRPYDEATAAAATARHLGLAHEPVPCTVEQLAEGFLDGMHATGVPTNNLSTTARLAMARAVRASGAKALTGGEAADEIFGGYPYFGLEAIWRDLARGEPGARTALRTFEAEERPSRGVFWSGGRGWERTPPWLGHPSTVHLRALRAETELSRLLSRSARAELAGRTPLEALGAELDVARLRTLAPFDAARVVSRSVFGTFVVPALGDGVEMAASLEGRVPFLDREVVDLAYALPQELCVAPATYLRKRVLRHAFADRLPEGFRAPPKHTWMAPTFRELGATATGRALFADLLSDRAVRDAGLLSRRTVRAALAAWRWWPARGARFPHVDGVVGYLLSVQALHHVHVRTPPRTRTLTAWVDRTPAVA